MTGSLRRCPGQMVTNYDDKLRQIRSSTFAKPRERTYCNPSSRDAHAHRQFNVSRSGRKPRDPNAHIRTQTNSYAHMFDVVAPSSETATVLWSACATRAPRLWRPCELFIYLFNPIRSCGSYDSLILIHSRVGCATHNFEPEYVCVQSSWTPTTVNIDDL